MIYVFLTNLCSLLLTICIGKHKDLWKALKALGLPNRSGRCLVGTLAENRMVKLYNNSMSRTFKIFCSNLARNFLVNFPKPPSWYTSNFVSDYSKKIQIGFNNWRFFTRVIEKCWNYKSGRNWSNIRKIFKRWGANFSETYWWVMKSFHEIKKFF